MTLKISLAEARRLMIHSQGLDDSTRPQTGMEGVAQLVEHLGYVQIDTIAVVQRAHHHTLWTRQPDYTPEVLDHLFDCHRAFEYWARAASILPMVDFRYYLPRMRSFAISKRTRAWRSENAALVEDVLTRIREEGPLCSADFASEGRRGPWWDWKPTKQALESLFNTGELMVAGRRSFQRLYDLPERVIPQHISTTEPASEELGHFMVRRALRNYGVATAGDINWRGRNPELTTAAIEDLVNAGNVIPVEIHEFPGEAYYALAELSTREPPRTNRLHLLSPFDNFTGHRERLLRLFGFDYRLECYLPAAQRRHGYFCLPLLWGERFVGRLDPKAERKQKRFIIRRLTFEPNFVDYDALLPQLATRLRDFAAFNQCHDVLVEETDPGKVKTPLQKALEAYH